MFVFKNPWDFLKMLLFSKWRYQTCYVDIGFLMSRDFKMMISTLLAGLGGITFETYMSAPSDKLWLLWLKYKWWNNTVVRLCFQMLRVMIVMFWMLKITLRFLLPLFHISLWTFPVSPFDIETEFIKSNPYDLHPF